MENVKKRNEVIYYDIDNVLVVFIRVEMVWMITLSYVDREKRNIAFLVRLVNKIEVDWDIG